MEMESRGVPECRSLEVKSGGVPEVPEFGGYERMVFITGSSVIKSVVTTS